ncbi:hypothetical protein [Kitasatospora sp. KL5]|uniref:hypothetical protein n=1 Tax=Kitasatospora sp. KL5 TaxID=3425125 RepID=UPI003D6F8CD5
MQSAQRRSMSFVSKHPQLIALTFGETVWANVIGAAVAALLGLAIALLFTRRLERAQRQRDRDLATAADLYRVYGEFFAAWKAWDELLRGADPTAAATGQCPPDGQHRLQVLNLAAQAEGGMEALLVRLTQERSLNQRELATLWCLRQAVKQLRYAIRDDKWLVWWRAAEPHPKTGTLGHRKYQAFKALNAQVAGMLVDHGRRQRPRGSRGVTALQHVTGPGNAFKKRFEDVLLRETQAQPAPTNERDLAWLVVTECLYPDVL